MATTATQDGAAATEEVKLDLFEDDDEFEEFENGEWDDKEEEDALQPWEDDWDDDDVNDDFSQQLRAELEKNESQAPSDDISQQKNTDTSSS
ncbi:hypothetical protein SELMODRAFT_442197 [Selaginella moellendorffii]|uniref:26S proteasome complex subunit SEM1 n=1 Tax=Selaginella moellendorffii TaxID=88036 RepID=D8RRH8_SELML|nr:hypothetical protein SELMODRAFT_442197 [Selaginella moellendorffii]